MEDQVLTSAGFGIQSSAAGKGAPAPKSVVRRKVKEIIRRFIFDAAVMGNSSVSFPVIEKGVIIRTPSGEIKRKMINLEDKVYTLSKTVSKVNYNTMTKVFLEMGFRKDDRAVYGEEEVLIKLDDVPIVKKFRYKFGHPDNTPTDMMETTLGIGIEGETIKLEFVKGFVTVEDEKVAKALEIMGMYLVERTPIEDEDPPEGTPIDPDEPPPEEDNESDKTILSIVGDIIGEDEDPEADEELQLDTDENNDESEDEEL